MRLLSLLLVFGVLASAQQPTPPPQKVPTNLCQAAGYRTFDFWLGEWEAFGPKGQKAGDSRIEKILNDCVILENWTGANGYVGKSFNTYDKDTKKWTQHWADGTGVAYSYSGQMEGKDLVYLREWEDKGQKVIWKLTFSPLGPDEVRQFQQESRDGGKTWTVSYDLKYRRKK